MNSNTNTAIILIILLLVLIVSGSLTLYYLNNSADKLENSISAASDSVIKKEWSAAKKELADFSKDWNKTKYSWAMLIDHIEIDNIDDSFHKSLKYIESEDYPSALAELDALRHYILHIPEKENFSFENIL